MKRIRLDIAYDGTAFHGWARQDGLRTVQGEVEAALSLILRQPISLTVAGRTDSGVHARGQVAHFDLSSEAWAALLGRRGSAVASCEEGSSPPSQPQDTGGSIPVGGSEPVSSSPNPGTEPQTQIDQTASEKEICRALVRRVNSVMGQAAARAGILPATKQLDAVVLAAQVVTADFDARFSALSRHYVYRISDDPAQRNPLRSDVYWHDRTLDVEAMNRSATALLGEHDFLGFCRPREGASTVRTLQVFRFDRVADGVIEATIQADAFCHSMVRSLIGACLPVGEGRRPEDWPAQILAKANRQDAAPIAPAHGLTLEAVTYPEASEWAAQSQAARTFRG